MREPHWDQATKQQPPARDAVSRSKPRTCGCGHVLSRYNNGRLCTVCERLAANAQTLGSKADEERLAGRIVAGVYVSRPDYSDDRAYLRALTKALDELATLVGLDLPDFGEEAGDGK